MEMTGQLHCPTDATAQKETLQPSKESAGCEKEQMLIIQRREQSLLLCRIKE
jgi:hypothetical protein